MKPTMKQKTEQTVKTARVAEQPHRQHRLRRARLRRERLRRARLRPTEQPVGDSAAHEQPDDDPGSPRVLVAAPARRQDQRARAGRDEPDAQVVDDGPGGRLHRRHFEDDLPPEQIAELPHQGRGYRLRQQIRRHHPRHVLRTTQVRHDRLVEAASSIPPSTIVTKTTFRSACSARAPAPRAGRRASLCDRHTVAITPGRHPCMRSCAGRVWAVGGLPAPGVWEAARARSVGRRARLSHT